METWISTKIQLPPEGVPVQTKIDDHHGERNQCKLIRHGRLWFFEDKTMYVYYTPTHWCHLD